MKCFEKYLIAIFIPFFIFSCTSVNSLKKTKETSYEIKKEGEKFVFDKGYAYRREGMPVQLYLSGNHYEMGLQYGVLAKKELTDFVTNLYRLVLNHATEMNTPKDLVYTYLNNRIKKLSQGMPERFKTEIRGISKGSGLHEDAIYAISLFDDLVHSIGCTSICAKTDDGKLLHGRNEDNFLGMEMGLKHLLISYNPDGYNAFVALSLPGFIGVSTGSNEKGLGYSHNSRYTRFVDLKGIPQHCLPRLALEECNSLSEVKELYNGKSVCIGDSHTWSDKNNLSACIIEMIPGKPEKTAIIDMGSKALWHINSYASPELKNLGDGLYADTGFNNARQLIMEEKMASVKSLSVDKMISILREENSPSGGNMNCSHITRAVCNVDTQLMLIFDPNGNGLYLARDYYYAAKAEVFFIPFDFEKMPLKYMGAEQIPNILKDIAKIHGGLMPETTRLENLKMLASGNQHYGFLYFHIAQLSSQLKNKKDWIDYTEKAYQNPFDFGWQELLLEKAKLSFYKNDMNSVAKFLENLKFPELYSYISRAEYYYLYYLYYKKVNNKEMAKKSKVAFELLEKDKKRKQWLVKNFKKTIQ